MNNTNHILAYIPNKYKDEVAASVDDLQVEFQDSLIDFIESMTEGEYIAALFYSDNYQEISNTVSSAVTIDFPLIRIINYMNEEQIVDSIKLGFDNCVSLDNILRLHRVIKLNRQVSIKNKQKKSISSDYIKAEMLHIFDLMPNMILLKDAETFNYVFINSKAEEVLGIQRENIIGKNVFDIIPEEIAKHHHQKDLEAVRTKSPVFIKEELIPIKKNNVIYIDCLKVLIHNHEKTNKYILDFSLDNTEKKVIENKLDIAQKRFKTIFNSSPNILIIESLQSGQILEINPSCEKLLASKQSNITGKSIKELGLWIDDYKVEEMQNIALNEGNAHNQIVRLIDSNGELKYYMLSIDYITSGMQECLLYTGMDITDKSEGEIELKKLLRKQKNLSQLKNRFISLISHEFRTPLTTIMLSTDLLKRYSFGWDEIEKNKHFDRIQNTILNMTKMLENVTTLSKIESKEIDLVPERINLIQFAQAMAETASINIQSDLKIDLEHNSKYEEIISDENLLGLSLINIIYNSIRFTKDNTPVKMEIDINESLAKIKISDSGVGINEKDLQYITQAFYRGDNAINIPGYGLGLAITEKALEIIGGSLDISSTLNLGTCVSISIPRKLS